MSKSKISRFRRNLIKKRKIRTGPYDGVLQDIDTTNNYNDTSSDGASDDDKSPDTTDDASDEDWLPESNRARKHARGKSKSLYIIRQKNIKVEGDDKVFILLIKLGFKRFLRRKISRVLNMNSTQQATQIVKRCASFIAFNLLQPRIKPTKNAIIEFLAMMTHPSSHKRLQKFLEYLRKEGYKPRTISHNVDYVNSLMEWGVHELQELDKLTHVPFLEYAAKLRSKVVSTSSMIINMHFLK
jgi:hypothetical protein